MKKLLLSVLSIFIAGVVMVAPVFADTKCIQTSILGKQKCEEKDGDLIPSNSGTINCSCDQGKGESIKEILKTVVDIMSIGIGILAILGVSISGIQYLTASGNEEKARKAKRRILEIVIGLVAYVLIYGILQFLLPGFEGINKL